MLRATHLLINDIDYTEDLAGLVQGEKGAGGTTELQVPVRLESVLARYLHGLESSGGASSDTLVVSSRGGESYSFDWFFLGRQPTVSEAFVEFALVAGLQSEQ